MNAISSKGWFPCLDNAIAYRDVPAFPTKKAAQEAAKQYGWSGKVIRIARRCENVWIVGGVDFQEDNEGGIRFECLRVPMLRWEEKDGVKYCPVLKVRKPILPH